VLGEEVDLNGVRILGLANLPGRVAVHASQMYSANLFNLVDEFWNKAENKFKLDLEDEILKSCVLTHDGKVLKEF
jgi:NAD(P) transhydrogenase subunit alpha